MIQKIKQLLVTVAAGVALLVPATVPVLVAPAVSADTITDSVCQGVNNAANNTNASTCGTAGTNATDLHTVANKIVGIFSIIVGIISVIMIIYAGFRYITSGGDSGKVGSAKNSLIYAIVGLVIVALAQVIVHYVLNTGSGLGGSTGLGT